MCRRPVLVVLFIIMMNLNYVSEYLIDSDTILTVFSWWCFICEKFIYRKFFVFIPSISREKFNYIIYNYFKPKMFNLYAFKYVLTLYLGSLGHVSQFFLFTNVIKCGHHPQYCLNILNIILPVFSWWCLSCAKYIYRKIFWCFIVKRIPSISREKFI